MLIFGHVGSDVRICSDFGMHSDMFAGRPN